MKLKYASNVIAIMLVVTSCTKYGDIETKEPSDFNVTVDKATYKVGDSVIFKMSSAVDQIAFFSGENGKRYEYKDKTTEAGTPKLVFQSNMTQGLLTNPDSLKLYISSNLKGYDSASVVNATWTDITARNTKWPASLTTTFTTSDSIGLADFNSADSVNIAFRVMNKNYATSAQRRWQVQNLTLTNFLANGTSYPLFSSFANIGWAQVSVKNSPVPNTAAFNTHTWNVGQFGVNANNSTLIIGGRACNSNGVPIATGYPLTFDPSTAVNTNENDDWIITSAINLKTIRPDVGVTIKNAVNAAFAGLTYVFNATPGVYAQYVYRYTTPGVYNVVFVGSNINNGSVSKVVRQVQITVVP
jgi:Domain of unknown function (DUF5017)